MFYQKINVNCNNASSTSAEASSCCLTGLFCKLEEMEPPKKRKFDCGVVGLSSSLGSSINTKLDDQLQVVSNSDVVPAKRNRRSYSLEFKVAVLDSYYNDSQTKLNQRKTALKYGVNRRQIQKWLAQEDTLRGSVGAGYTHNHSLGQVPPLPPPPVSTTNKHHPGPLTVVEEQDFVIDEAREYKYNYEDDNKPINLCKANTIKVEQHQVGDIPLSFERGISTLHCAPINMIGFYSLQHVYLNIPIGYFHVATSGYC